MELQSERKPELMEELTLKICFFCLKEFKETSTKSCEKSDHPPQFFLRNVFQYMEIFERKAKSTEVNEKLLDLDLSTELCQDCSKLAKEFTDLYKLLEEARLRINLCVHMMTKQMTTAEEDNKTQSRLQGHQRNLRREAMDKMGCISTSSPPQVTLNKLEISKPQEAEHIKNENMEQVPETLGAEISCNLCNQMIPSQNYTSHVISCETIMNVGNPSTWKSLNPTTSSPVKRKRVKRTPAPTKEPVPSFQDIGSRNGMEDGGDGDGVAKQLSCSFCRATFQEARKSNGVMQTGHGRTMLRLHVVQNHCETFFPNEKCENVTLTQFQKIITELLFQDLLEGKTSCSYCEKKFVIPSQKSTKTLHYSRVKLHYVETHHNQLAEKLVRIQQNPNLFEILENCNRWGKICTCGFYCKSKLILKLHQKLHCRLTERQEYFMPSGRPPRSRFQGTGGVGHRVKCNLCGAMLKRGSIWGHTKICYHKSQMSTTTSSSPELQSSVSDPAIEDDETEVSLLDLKDIKVEVIIN